MIGEAAVFAERAHRGVFRKGTDIPYITHPMEAAVIVSAFTDDEEMIAAALLHDVMEDAGVTREELEQAFGPRVAWLVMDESEDKRKTWQERKGYTVRHLMTASRGLRYWLWGTSSAICGARPEITWSWGITYGSALMRRIRESMRGITGELHMH